MATLSHANETKNEHALSARQIMMKVNGVKMGNNAIQDMTMTLTDKHGRERIQSAHFFRIRTGDGPLKVTRSLMFFTAPENMKNTGFLSWDFDDPRIEDKQWIYLPRSNRTKRIAGNDKRLSFMGTDFSHADMAMRNIHNYNYTITSEEMLNEHKVWVIESTPVSKQVIAEDGYTKSILYIRQDNFITLRTINTLKRGKRSKQMDVTNLIQVEGIWIPQNVVMATSKMNTLLSKTAMTTSNTIFNQTFFEHLFTVKTLERGLDNARAQNKNN